MNSPKHVAIIMDGNGRWGLKKRNSRRYGHKKVLETVDEIIQALNILNGITFKYICIYLYHNIILIFQYLFLVYFLLILFLY